MKKLVLATAIATLAIAPLASAETKHNGKRATETAQKERVGTLSCEIAGGVGLVVGSSKAVNCEFRQRSGKTERYTGKIGKLGLDIGVTGKTYTSWIVLNTAASRVGDGALSGDYVGASAGASVGVGVGANALIGGNAKNFALQPISAEVGTGVNVAAGVSHLQLKRAG
ncbi:DUF992 domain-containing protein [Agrobacterium pusense]|uniref:DUF992 domain-containing protein n=1 Tax=Agrobacterium pusense TaxID=648995 RepID=UPI00088D93A9|nr:DUF992 domain-containing protein [Agrobacterium pusense]OOO23950.1 hypothetical protein BTE56_00580 [Agrobacterium pusense]WKD44724.1 DUF992 domain-containing protein [Agrobacterium pusense]SDE81687.1 Protein of unknown function [Agrobacterium pusense]